MRWSTLFIPTLREAPAEAESVSHKLLLRAGYIRQLSAGIYTYLLLARQSLLKMEKIAREEMNAIGGQEILLPPCAGTSDKEAVSLIARGELRSYKQLPQIWYHIQAKFRSYSLDLNADRLEETYSRHQRAFSRILDRCGLEYLSVEAHSGSKLVFRSECGEDFIVECKTCGYAADLEKAFSRASEPLADDPEGELTPEEFHTPGLRTIADIAAFTKLPESSQMKSLVMVADGTPILIMVRGDHQLSETKLAEVLEAAELRPANPQEIVEYFGASAGSLGPVGVKNMRVLADSALAGRRNMISGANRDDYHLKNVTPGEDFKPEYFDLRRVSQGDECLHCGARLEVVKGIEIGDMFKLGRRYSETLGLRVLGEDGKEITPMMGSYTLGIERILTCAVELHHDKDGIVLPLAIAPFAAIITPVNYREASQSEAADLIYEECAKAGIDVLLDDRDERPGVKFKDADLIGVPYRITLGKRLTEGKVEFLDRRTRASEEVVLRDVVTRLQRARAI